MNDTQGASAPKPAASDRGSLGDLELRELIDTLPDLVGRFDASMRPIYMNRAAEEMMRWCADYYAAHPDEAIKQQEWLQAQQQALATG